MTESTGNIDNSEELIEEWDWERAVPTGRSIARKKAHKEGIAHEGVHLWVIRTSNGYPEILFQHRASHKDTYPDCLDITVGGHVPFGTNENKIQKESYEEIGITPKDSGLVDLGLFRYEERLDNFFHREFQRVYLILDNRPLDEYSFTDGEVDGIFAVKFEDLEKLLSCEPVITVEGFEESKIISKKVARKDFHPLLFSDTMKEYMDVVIAGAKEVVSKGTVTARMPSPV